MSEGVGAAWPIDLALHELGRGAVERRLIAEGPALERIARVVGVDTLKSLEVNLRIRPWLDGAEIDGRWSAVAVQTCGITLEPFESRLAGELGIRAVPTGSAALSAESEHDLDLDPEADDPPDEIVDGVLHLGAYVVEDLSLAIDPFPRKPGVAFEAPQAEAEPSPFAVLARLKDKGEG
jgi:uncharacterized metal-binding protein YceD (DUF177 family)